MIEKKEPMGFYSRRIDQGVLISQIVLCDQQLFTENVGCVKRFESIIRMVYRPTHKVNYIEFTEGEILINIVYEN